MKKTHSSHTIFIFLGILLLLFMLVFGIEYFRSQYRFDPIDSVAQSQSYDEGKKLYNPFTTNIEASVTLDTRYNWISFQSDTLSFMYPDIFSLKIHSSSHLEIRPPIQSLSNVDCSRVECDPLPMSPAITILSAEDSDWESDQEFIREINNQGTAILRSTSETDTLGRTVLRVADRPDVSIGYMYHDIGDDSRRIATLRENYGRDIYLLSQSEQDSLSRNILSTLEIR